MKKGFEVPNHTQTPNGFFDVSLKEIRSLAEIKIVLAIIRQTFGWHKRADRISLSQLQRLTGLSRESVSTGIQAALDHGYISRQARNNSFVYSLKLVKVSDQSELPTSQEFRPVLVKNSDHLLVKNSDPQKKLVKENKQTYVAQARQVFGFWQLQMSHPKAKLDGKRQRAIAERLKDGFSVDDLCDAVRGCKLTPHNMGENDRQKVYDDIELICRDAKHVEHFMDRASKNGNITRMPTIAERMGYKQ